MSESALKPGLVLTGPLFNEPMRVETVRPGGNAAWIAGLVGLQSERFRNVSRPAIGPVGIRHRQYRGERCGEVTP